MTVFWLICVFMTFMSGLCAAMSSSYRERGDSERAQTMAESAIGLCLLAICSGVAAWWIR